MQIFITRGEEKSGPFTLDQVREHLDKGHLMSDDLACQEGMDEWIPLSRKFFESGIFLFINIWCDLKLHHILGICIIIPII